MTNVSLKILNSGLNLKKLHSYAYAIRFLKVFKVKNPEKSKIIIWTISRENRVGCMQTAKAENAGQLGLGSSRPESSRPGSTRPDNISAWSYFAYFFIRDENAA